MFGESNVSYKKGESSQFPITIDFSSKSHTLAMRGEPVVTKIKLNDVTICSGNSVIHNESVIDRANGNGDKDKAEEEGNNSNCVKFEINEVNDGRLNGTLSFFSRSSQVDFRVDLTFNNPLKVWLCDKKILFHAIISITKKVYFFRIILIEKEF